MGLSVYADAFILIAISFLLIKKRQHVAVYLFVFLLMVFLYASFVSIVVDNLSLWKVNQRTIPFVLFRISELILFPLVATWFIELFFVRNSISYKAFIVLSFLSIVILLEQWLSALKIIEYQQWSLFYTAAVWIGFGIVVLLTRALVIRQLIKERVVPDAASAAEV